MARTKFVHSRRTPSAALRRAQPARHTAAPGAGGAADVRAAGMLPSMSCGPANTDDNAAPRVGEDAVAEAHTRAVVAASADAQAGDTLPQSVTEVSQKQPPLGGGGEQPGDKDAGCAGAALEGALVLQAVPGTAAHPEAAALQPTSPEALPEGPLVPMEDMVPPLLRILRVDKKRGSSVYLSETEQRELLIEQIGGVKIRALLEIWCTTAQLPDDCEGAPPLKFRMYPSKKDEPSFVFEVSRELVIRMRLEAGWDQGDAEDSDIHFSSDDEVDMMHSAGSDSDDSSESTDDDADDEDSEGGKENAVAAAQLSETKPAHPASRGAARAAERAAERAAKAQEKLGREVERYKRKAERAQRTAADKAAKLEAKAAQAAEKRKRHAADMDARKAAAAALREKAAPVQTADELARQTRLLRESELDAERALAGLQAGAVEVIASPAGTPASSASASVGQGATARAALPPRAAAQKHQAVAHKAPLPRCTQCHQSFRSDMQCLELCCDRGCRALLHFDCGCSAALGSVLLVWHNGVRRRFKLDSAMRCLTALAGGDAACDGVTVHARVLPAELPVHNNAAAVKVLLDDREAAAARRQAAESARIAAAAVVAPRTPQRRSRAAPAKSQQQRTPSSSSDGACSPPVAPTPQVAVLNRAAPLSPQSKQALEAQEALSAHVVAGWSAAAPSAEHPPAAPAAAIGAMNAEQAAAALAELQRRTCVDAVTTSVLIEVFDHRATSALSSFPSRASFRAGSCAMTAAAVVQAAARLGVVLSAVDVTALPPHAAAVRVARLEDAVTLRTLMHGRCATALLPGAPAARLSVNFLQLLPTEGDLGAADDEPAAAVDAPTTTPRAGDADAAPAAPRSDDAGGASCGRCGSDGDIDDAGCRVASPSGVQHASAPPQPSHWADGILLALSSYELSYYAHERSFTVPLDLLRRPVTAQLEPTAPATALLLLDVLTGELHGVWAAVARPLPGAAAGVHFERVPPLASPQAGAPVAHAVGDASCLRLRRVAPRLCGHAAAMLTHRGTGFAHDIAAEEVACVDQYLSDCAAQAAPSEQERDAAAVGGAAYITEENGAPDSSQLEEALALVARFEADEALARALQAAEEVPDARARDLPLPRYAAPAAFSWRGALLSGVA